MNNRIKEAEEYANKLHKNVAHHGGIYTNWRYWNEAYNGYLAACEKCEREYKDLHGFKTIFDKDPINVLLVNALRALDDEKMCILTKSLLERCSLKNEMEVGTIKFIKWLLGEKVFRFIGSPTDEQCQQLLEQFKTHNNEHGNKG